ncbi:hypothetical protein EPUS_03271 [Endocarpon pusillum Z07020]|uniref:Uncharacterized protein n=1 Tax=Endocarpon pusillum (strain Z07020 / HMAS-L-300199) TaxID=1263415 RepID=U1G183_ENDPU|nr:uncharacterized protein EPUS_03271 [Endocarpon pusillum Z07020]ERF70992.1 hypothetical protein EPUS_03271 [Endocarpon pusillum Z07020]
MVLQGCKVADSMGKVVDSMRRRKPYFEVPMVDLWEEEQASERLDGIYGSDLRKAMTTGVGHLANAFPDLREDRKAKLIGPNLEGVGWYPTVNEDSRAAGRPSKYCRRCVRSVQGHRGGHDKWALWCFRGIG